MSLPKNNLALTLSEVPLKIFVKATNELHSEITQKDKFELGFNGNEAKSAYDEIILLESQRRPLPKKRNPIIGDLKDESKSSNKKLVRNETNVNILFKAIELGDECFVSQNFQPENVNISDQFGWTPLMSAAFSGHIEIVKLLLKLGANTQARDKSGLTAIDLALKKNHLDIINLLKQNPHKHSRRKTAKNIDVSDNFNKDESTEINQEGFYCDICQIFFMESSKIAHETSTLHIFNTKPKLKNAFYGIPKQNKGYQMLLSTGWNEEDGLGPTGEGKKYPVKTILKRDRKGFGQTDKNIARVTHFPARDSRAVKSLRRVERSSLNKKHRQKQLSKEAAKTRALRQTLS